MLTQQQLDARKGLITSSIAAAVLGLDQYTSPRQAKEKILGRQVTATSACMQRGDLLEQVTVDYAGAETGLMVHPADFVAHANGWSGDSADGLLVDKATGEVCALVEAKTVALGDNGKWGAPGTDEVPDRVLVQAQWHLIHHPGVDLCYVPVLVGGYDFSFKLYRVGGNREFQNSIYAECKRWHERYIENDLEVPPSHMDCDEEELKKRYPCDNGEFLQGSAQHFDLVKRHELAKARKDEAEKLYDLLRNQLRDLLADHAGIRGDGYTVSYKNSKPKEVTDWRACAQALGVTQEVISAHTQTRAGCRTLRVTLQKAAAPTPVETTLEEAS